MAASGLGVARTGICIRFSRAVGYLELFENVEVHGYGLVAPARTLLSVHERRRAPEHGLRPFAGAVRRATAELARSRRGFGRLRRRRAAR